MDEIEQLYQVVKQNQQAQLIFVGIALTLIAFYMVYRFMSQRHRNGNEAEALATALIDKLNGQAQAASGDDTRFYPGLSPTCMKHAEGIAKMSAELPHMKKAIDKTTAAVEKNAEKARENFGTVFTLLREIKNGD